MKTDAGKEQLFIDDIETLDFIGQDLAPIMLALKHWLAQCQASLDATRLAWPGLKPQHPLVGAAEDLNTAVVDCMTAAAERWKRLAPAQDWARSLDDKLVLLVFGKFNAGKSSFCNLLAERFASHGKPVSYFHLEAGRMAELPDSFQEGVTETTARLQGVRLAGRLVLVDTPGLHSVTPENAALTQLFTDSADAVLWLTSSTSPGQVQELDQLGRELHRHKPLLPVLTRSDVYDEDEIDGEIVKILRNKTAANRAEQEDDVSLRAAQKLAAMKVSASLLKPPVSISSYLARAQGQTRTALSEAGFEQLYAALSALVEPALAYKRRKHAEVLLHHLEESVLGALQTSAAPRIGHVRASAGAARAALKQQSAELAAALWRMLVPQLPALIDAYYTSGDWRAVVAGLSQAVHAAYAQQVARHLGAYEMDVVPCDLAFDELAPPRVSDPADIDYQGLYAALTKAVRHGVLNLCDKAAAQCLAAVDALDDIAQHLDVAIQSHHAELLQLKAALRPQSS